MAEALFGIPYVMVETYDPNSPPYYLKVLSDDDYMIPGLGYWVTVTDQAMWTLDNGIPAEGLI